ncbi:MAG: hypothetical protein KBD01_19155, partial [Acidobacteria bacterium]|nr:hypothetical protein [Acidobacteriota bacterium]
MRRPERLRAGQGFSLAEVLVALAITALLFIVALSVLSIDHKLYAKGDAVLECEREARYAAEMLERDLLMTGFQVDVRTIADPGPDGTDNTDDDIVGQPQIATATPWELVVNADLDAAVDAIQDGTTGEAVPSGYAPVTFFTSAETVRYTLDSNGDGAVTADDRGDEPEETATQNPGLYLLRREVYGFNGTDNENPHGPVALVRGPATYPNGAQPVPLFLYWGEFDSDAALDLWGDTGAGGGTVGNGLLEPGEIAALTAVTDEDADNDSVIDSGEDRNGNGTLERRITQLIKRVEIHITTETPYPDPDYRDPVRSSTTTPFRYHTSTLTTEIKPRNTDLPGGACGDIPEPTSSPGVANACADAMADGKVQVTWTASDDDGTNENDIERYVLFRTDVDNIFGPTPYEEVLAGTSAWTDQWIEMRTWPPRQYWYRVRAMDCTPQLSDSDPVAGPYPAEVGASYPEYTWASDVPADDGTNVELVWTKSPDEGANTSGYGGVVDEYHVYRSTSPDYRCVAPVNDDAVAASGAATYTYMDNDTNSSSALTLGTLYYYWLRTLDDNGVLSPYSPRYCARPFVGPTFPIQRRIRVVPYASNDHPVEVYFANNPKNDNAGYNKYLIDYKIYRSDLSLVDIPTGYTSTHLEATVELQGLVWTAGGTSVARALHSINGGTNWRTYNNGS